MLQRRREARAGASPHLYWPLVRLLGHGDFTAADMGSPDICYTRAPASIKLLPDYMHDSHSTFWAVARLAFPEERKRVLDKPEEHPVECLEVVPDMFAAVSRRVARKDEVHWEEVVDPLRWSAVGERWSASTLLHGLTI